MFGKIPFDTENHKSVILQRLNEMREIKTHCDFVLKIGSEKIEAHKNILSAGSDYFAAMLSHDTKENQTGIAEIKEVEAGCARKCIELIYTGMPPDLNDNIEQLMYTAHLLQMTSLCEGIWKVFENELNLETFYLILRLANLYNCKQLCEKCDCFALENFETVYKMEEFCRLDKSYIEKMVISEEILDKFKLDALLRWVNFNVVARSEFLDEMMQFVTLPEVPVGFIRYFIENEPLVNNNIKLLKTFSLAVMDNMNIKPTNSASQTPQETDKKTETEYSIAVFDNTSGYLQGFNPTDNNWIQMHEMNDVMMKNYFSAIYVDKYIYVFMKDKSVYRLRYLDKTATWEQVGNMIDDHGWFPPCFAVKNKIYVIGGKHYCSSKSVEMFDPVSNKWFKLADKPQAIDGSQPVVLDDKIYCCGGIVDWQYTTIVQCFNPDGSSWIYKAPMNEAKCNVSAVVCDDKIYVLGGYNGNELGAVECYDPGSNEWSFLEPMNKPRSLLRSFVIMGDIYAVGGHFSSPKTIEKYDIRKNEWEDVEMPNNMKLVIKESAKIEITF